MDCAPTAIRILQKQAQERAVELDARVADLEKGEFRIEPVVWDPIVIYRYLHRDLFEPAKLGVRPGGVLLAVVLITTPGEEPSYKRIRPGELAEYFQAWEILHNAEHYPVAEIVARRPTSPSLAPGSSRPIPWPPLY